MENFKNIKCVSRKGTYTISTPQGDFPLAVESCDMFPDKSRSVANMFGNEMIDIRNGDKGWKTNQMGKLGEKTADDIAKDKKDLMRTTLYIFMTADKPDYQPVYNGSEKLDGKDVECVALLDADGNKICRIGFYKDSKILAFKSYWGQMPTGEGNITDTFDNFSDIEGVKVPLVTNSSMDGQQVMKAELTEYNINPELPADFFSKPE